MKEKELKSRVISFLKDVVTSYDLEPLLNSEGAKLLNEMRVTDLEDEISYYLEWRIDDLKEWVKCDNVVDFSIKIQYHEKMLNTLKRYLNEYSYNQLLEDITELIERKEKENE